MSLARNLARLIVDASGNIDASNLDNAVPADGSITEAKLANSAVTDAKIAANAVGRSEVGYSGAVLKITAFQQKSLTGTTTSTSFIDSGWSFSITAERNNPIILLDWYFNNAQNDTWNGGSVRWLRSIAGGSYVNIAGEDSNSGHNFVSSTSGNSNKSSGFAFTSFDDISSGVTAGQTITYKLQMKAWSSSNLVKIGVSTANGDAGYDTSTAGTQYFKFTEIAR
jgi:hypothetical protein